MNLPVFSKDGKKTSKSVTLDKGIFESEINEHAVWLDVKALMANRRQGTHATKGRSYVSGGGRKPFRQKGTGRARQGTIRAPHHVGGGRVFGPEPRDYTQKVNRKLKKVARRSVLADKAKNQQLIVVEDFNYDEPKTRLMKDFIGGLKLDGQKVLLITADYAPNVFKAAHNMYRVNVKENIAFSSYDVISAQMLVIQEGALAKIKEVLS